MFIVKGRFDVFFTAYLFVRKKKGLRLSSRVTSVKYQL